MARRRAVNLKPRGKRRKKQAPMPMCDAPDRDVPALKCGYPMPCPHHSVLVVIGEAAEMKPPETPTLDRMRELKVKSQAIGEFLEWLQHNGVQLMFYHEHSERCEDEDGDQMCGLSEDSLMPEHRGIERLLADFFEIDLKKVEEERTALLDWQRALNG